MAISMKGIFRGLKVIAQIFMQREHEIEIGYPTDVRHVSHIGVGASGSCPSWMSEFRGVEEVAAAAGTAGGVSSATPSRQTSWASLDFDQPAGAPPPAEASSSAATGATGAGTPRGGPKRPKKAARSSSWRSTASFATACCDSGELPAAALRAA